MTKKSVTELTTAILKSQADTNRIILFLELGGHYLFKPGHEQRDIDSALLYYGKARKLSLVMHLERWHMEALKLEGDAYLENEDLVSGHQKFYQVIAYYKQRNDLRNQALVWLRLEQCIPYRRENMDEKTTCLEHARSLYVAMRDPISEVEVLKTIADRNLNFGRLDLAERQLLQVLVKYKAFGEKKLHHVYFLLASVNRLKGDLQKELFYNLETINSMESTGDTAYRSRFFYEIARTYKDLDKYNQSLEFYLKARAIMVKQGKGLAYGIYVNTREVVELLIAQNKPEAALQLAKSTIRQFPPATLFESGYSYMILGLCYNSLNEPEKAEKCYLGMMKYTNRLMETHGLSFEDYITQCKLISAFYIRVKKYRRADLFLSHIAKVPPGTTTVTTLSEIQLLFFKSDSAAGRLSSAISHYKLYKKFNDSVFNIAKSQQIEELQVRYSTAQKEKELKLLQATDKLRERDLIEAETAKKFYLFGLLMLLGITGILYSRYRVKQKANEQLKASKQVISDKNSALEQLLKDNEWLLKEVHHRVKNNLQTIVSLLTSQSVYLQDDAAFSAVMDSQHRIQTMSLLHQKLYKGNSYSTIYMPEYINELLSYLKESYQLTDHVCLEQQIAAVHLDVAQAVPLGLILNEAVTNAIKHAFPDPGDHVILVVLNLKNDEIIELTVSDNGAGFPDDLVNKAPNSFGITLMHGLVGDLSGTILISGSGGTAVSVTFKKEQIGESGRAGSGR